MVLVTGTGKRKGARYDDVETGPNRFGGVSFLLPPCEDG